MGVVCQGELKNDKNVIYYSFVIIIYKLKSECYNVVKGGDDMKHYLSWLVAMLLFLCLAGCQAKKITQATAPEPSATEPQSQEMSHDELAKIVAKNLDVPDGLDFTYEISERFYWEAGEVWFRNVVIHVEDGVSARASVDPTNGDLLRGILNYQKPE